MSVPKNWVGTGHGIIVPRETAQFKGRRREEQPMELPTSSRKMAAAAREAIKDRFPVRVESAWSREIRERARREKPRWFLGA